MGLESTPRRSALCLSLIAAASAAIYLGAFLLPYPLLRYFSTPLMDLGKITRYGVEAAILFAGAFAGLFALYGAGYQFVLHVPASRGIRLLVTCAPIAFALTLIWVVPLGAIDVYDYAFYGKMLAVFHVSPLTHVPQEFGQDPWLPFVGWAFAVSPYGPLWQWLSSGIYSAAGGELLANLLGYKLLAVLAFLGGAALVYLMLRRNSREQALAGFYFIAWNPLLLFETATNGHNDAVMILLVLLMLLAFRDGRPTFAGVALTCAMLIKFPAVVAAPVLCAAVFRILSTWKQRTKWLILTGVAASTVALLAYLPLADRANPFSNVLTRTDLFTTSGAAVVVHLLRGALGVPSAQSVARTLASGSLMLALAWIAWSQRGDKASIGRGTYGAFLALLTLATIWFQPWYVTWIVMLAPLADASARRVAVIFSASVLAIYFVYDFFLWWDTQFWFERDQGLTLNVVTTALVFGPPLLALALEHLRPRQMRRSSER